MDAKSFISNSSQDEVESSSKEIDVVVDGVQVIDDDNINNDHDHEESLPGYRFHPTDEELVSFYLTRKVSNRSLSIEIIKQMDIYKHDPWDLAKASSSVGHKEWYFYCKRGRKYRNSIRPNRVTGSGFWKATGIDRPIYSNGGEGHQCVGLKKSLVYYRGSAGKGTKTDWMMHEFRLPTHDHNQHQHHNSSNIQDTTAMEAEIWTLCRIFKRKKRHTPDWRELCARKNTTNSISSKASNIDIIDNKEHYISFATSFGVPDHNGYKCVEAVDESNTTNKMSSSYEHVNTKDQQHIITTSDQKNNVHYHQMDQQQQQQWNSMCYISPDDVNDFQSFAYYENNWDDLNSVVDFATSTSLL